MRFVVAVAVSLGCRAPGPAVVTTPAPNALELATTPEAAVHEAMLVLDDIIVTASNGKGTVRSATHAGIELEWADKQAPTPDQAIEDRGAIQIKHGTQTCRAEVAADDVLATCGDLVVAYQRGTVTIIHRDPLGVIGTGRVFTAQDFDCGTHAIDNTAIVGSTTVEMYGYRTIRCTDGSHTGPLIF